ncbi:MAG: hypothetical protein ACI9U2_004816, partial [Bradymonadia bacterium]
HLKPAPIPAQSGRNPGAIRAQSGRNPGAIRAQPQRNPGSNPHRCSFSFTPALD